MKFFQYILLAFWFLLTNAAFAQDDATSWRSHLKIVTKKGKQGVYNTKTKRFVIKPVYDEIYKNLEKIDLYTCVKIIKKEFGSDEDNKYETETIVIDSNNNAFVEINSCFIKYILVRSANGKKGIFDDRQGNFITKVEFDTILFLNGSNFGYQIYDFLPHSYANYKPNKDLYAILGKKNTYQIFNVCEGMIDKTAYIIDVNYNPKVLYDYNSHDIYRSKYDSKLQVVNFPDSNYEFDSSFVLLNSVKVNILNTDIVKHHNKYGLYTFEEGKFYLPIEYDSILQEKNHYKTYKNGKLGYARRWKKDDRHSDSTNYNYTIITVDSNFEQVVDFDNEIYTVKINGKWEFRNFSDNNRYDSIYIVNEKYTYSRKVFLKKDGKWSLNITKEENYGWSRISSPRYYINKRKNEEIYKVMKQKPCCGYEYQTHFLWDSIAIINGNNYWHVAKQNNKILILNDGGRTLIKLKENKVSKIDFEKIQYQYNYFSAERIDWEYKAIKKENKGEKEFVYVLVNKKPLLNKPYKVKRYLQNGKLVRQPTFKKSIYAEIKNYLSAHKRARKENRKLKEK